MWTREGSACRRPTRGGGHMASEQAQARPPASRTIVIWHDCGHTELHEVTETWDELGQSKTWQTLRQSPCKMCAPAARKRI